jgi:GT2 family glycosyltransferase
MSYTPIGETNREGEGLEKVSVVIPTHNRRNELKECLNSLYRQDYPNFEVLVIDNGSTDGTKEMILHQYPDVRYFRFKKNFYACKTRNFGVAQSLGSFVWFLDSDSIIHRDDCLSRMLELMKSDKKIGSIGGTIYSFENKSTKIVLPRDNKFDVFDDWDQESFQLDECDFLPSSNLLMRKEVLLRVGGFVEIYRYLLEDNDIGIRIKKQGLKNITDRRTVALHPFRSPQKDLRKSYLFYRNIFLYVFLNYRWENWVGIITEQLRKKLDGSRDRSQYGTTGEPKRLSERLKVYIGFLSGFVSVVIFMFIPVSLWIRSGKFNYITQYIGKNDPKEN